MTIDNPWSPGTLASLLGGVQSGWYLQSGKIGEMGTLKSRVTALVAAMTLAAAIILAAVAPGQVKGQVSGPFAYVANSSSDNVSVVDTSTHSILTTATLAGSPCGIAVLP